MAKEKAGSSNPESVPAESVKNADIITAAKSSMDDGDYSKGYPAPSGALRLNNKYPTGKKGS